MEQARLIHLSMEIWGIIFTLLTYFCEWMGRKTDVIKGKKIRIMLLMTSLLLLSDVLAWTFRGNVSMPGMFMTRISNAATFFLHLTIAEIFIDFMCCQSENGPWKKYVRLACNILLFTVGGLLALNLIFPFLYTFDDTNHYYRLPGYFLFYIPSLFVWVVGAYVIVKNMKKWDVNLKTEAIVVFVSVLGSIILQLFVYGVSYTVLGYTVFVLLIVYMHLAEKSNTLLVRENELKEMQMLQLRAQMQPHFMFNSLTTIRSLIRRDPDEAYLAITDFSRYLRGSVTVLSDVKNWSITQEMQMVEGYLSLEKRRFGDALQITIDVKDDDFTVPVLCIQTLVENAVRHGICAMTGGSGSLLVKTERQGLYHIVTIQDDGVGFDPSAPVPDDGRVHTGLANSRRRVEENGEMIVESSPGNGTTIILKFLD